MNSARALAACAAAAALCLLAACASRSQAPASAASPAPAPAASDNSGASRMGANGRAQMVVPIASGTYRCELDATVDIQSDPKDPTSIRVGWRGKNYQLARTDSKSGLQRYEDKSSRLAWVTLPWKSVLLDGRSGKPLANECKV